MRGRWVQNPIHGVARIEPLLSGADPFERFVFIAQVMLSALGFFIATWMPVELLAGIAASCLAGDAVIALRYILRVEDRPPAQVTELAARRLR